jgi:hypothetical protein
MVIAKSNEQQDRGGILGPVRALGWSILQYIQMDAVYEASVGDDSMDRYRPDI